MKGAARLAGMAMVAMVVAVPVQAGMIHGNMDAGSAPAAPAQKGYAGTKILEQAVEGYTVTYQLLNLQERAVMMKGMEGMEMAGMSSSPEITNHLMVYLKGADGKLAAGKVGFQIVGPDDKKQETLTMGMFGGYGADVVLKAPGAYKIKMKAALGDKTLVQDVVYEKK